MQISNCFQNRFHLSQLYLSPPPTDPTPFPSLAGPKASGAASFCVVCRDLFHSIPCCRFRIKLRFVKNICFPDPNILLLFLPFPFSPSFDFRLLKNLFNVVLVRFQEGVISDTRIQRLSQPRMLYYSSSTWVCVCVWFFVLLLLLLSFSPGKLYSLPGFLMNIYSS